MRPTGPSNLELAGAAPVTPARAGGRSARAALRRALRAAVRCAVITPGGLAAVNRVHGALSLTLKRRFFYLCHDLPCRVEGRWRVDFGGRRLVLPLRRDFELSWPAAIGFHGYDPEIHELYEALVRGPHPPRVFFDVGASYGLHSLKLLAHGVRVVSFEPNPECPAFFVESCRLNGVSPDVRAVAVGRAAGLTTLVVPVGRTYLGSTAPDTIDGWADDREVTVYRVSEVTLDGIVSAEGIVPDVVKIDTEGSELAVLNGAETVLERVRPLVVLESWRGSSARAPIFYLLARHGYRLHALRFGAHPSEALTLDGFAASAMTNFLARPILPDM